MPTEPKAALQSAVLEAGFSILMPGVGSLISLAARRALTSDDEQKITKALKSAMSVTQRQISGRRLIKRGKARWHLRRARKDVKDAVDRRTLIRASTGAPASAERVGLAETPTVPSIGEAESGNVVDWAALAAAEALMAHGPEDHLADWREEFAHMLEVCAIDGLKGSDKKLAGSWRRMILEIESDREPRSHEIAEWSSVVTRAFEIELIEELPDYVDALDAHNRLAAQHALIHRLDQGRRSLGIIAAVLAALAAALGLDVALEHT